MGKDSEVGCPIFKKQFRAGVANNYRLLHLFCDFKHVSLLHATKVRLTIGVNIRNRVILEDRYEPPNICIYTFVLPTA